MSVRRMGVVAVLGLLLVACGDAVEEPDVDAAPEQDAGARPAGDEPDPTADDGAAPTPPVPGPAQVELIDAGEQPHTELRLAPELGDVAEVRITSEHVASGDAQESAAAGPPALTLELEVTDVSGEQIEVSFVVAETAAEDEQLASQLSSMHGTLDLDERGRVHDIAASFDAVDDDPPAGMGDDAAPLLTQAFDVLRVLPAFPRQPVGAGAVWTVEQATLIPGPAWEVATVTLEELDGERYTLRTEATHDLWQEWLDWQRQAADERERIAPPMWGDIDGEGTGEVDGALDAVVPQRARRSLEVTTHAESPDGEPLAGTVRIEDRLERD